MKLFFTVRTTKENFRPKRPRKTHFLPKMPR